MARITVDTCRICRCTATKPCNLPDERTCRDLKPIVQDECISCSRPGLKKSSVIKPRFTNKTPVDMRNITWEKRQRRYKVGIYVKSIIPGQKGKTEQSNFSVAKYGTRNAALKAAIAWRDEVREIAEMPPVNPQILLKEPPADPSMQLLPEDARQSLVTNRETLRDMLARQQEFQQFTEREKQRERNRQRVKPNHDGISRFKAEQQAWFEVVRENGLHANNVNLYNRHPKHKRIKVKL